jgi:hypothetical protein
MHPLLVQLPRRGPDTDRAQANPRVPIAMSLRTILLVLTGSVCACANHCPTTGFPLICAQGGSGIAKIDPSTSERRLMLIPFSAPSRESDSALAYNVQIDTPSKAAASSPRVDLPSSSTLSEKIVARIQAESRRRAADQISIDAAVHSFRSDPAPFRRLLSPRAASTTPRDVALTVSIFSPFDGEEGTKLTGNLRVKSSHTAIYVDSRVDKTVTDADVKGMMQGFDNVSLPRLHVLFGQESDIDGNGVVNVFLAAPDKVGSNVIGFFRPTDLLPDGAVSGVRSNEMEIVYIRTPDPLSFDYSLAQATMAHETFHLINFAQKSLPLFRSTAGTLAFTEAIFLNEGLAHLAEDLTGYGVGTPDLIKIYLKCINMTSLAGGGTTTSDDATCRIAAPGNDSIPRRGAAMLLLLYMFEQMGGAQFSATTVDDIKGDGIKFLQKLSHTTSIGIANLEESTGRTFFFWYADFAGVLALDNTNLSTDPRYNLVPEERDPNTNLYRFIRLRSSRVVNSSTVSWEGPVPSHQITAGVDTTLSDSLFVTGMQAAVLTVPANLQATITAKAGSGLALGLAIVPMP